MDYPANVIPLRCAGADSYDPDALGLGSDDVPATMVWLVAENPPPTADFQP